MDVGSTTVKAVVVENDRVLWQDYQRHHTRQAEKVLEFLLRMESECGLERGRDVVLFTGSGSGLRNCPLPGAPPPRSPAASTPRACARPSAPPPSSATPIFSLGLGCACSSVAVEDGTDGLD